MPRRITQTRRETHIVMKQTSYESTVVSWLMKDGWQVFTPILDHGHKTDILISDGPNYHRIQIKTVEAARENHIVKNRWKDSNCDVVVFFARNSTWGYVTPAFVEEERPLNHQSHQRFDQSAKDFLKAFHKL